MWAGNAASEEILLLPAICMAAVGTALVLLLLHGLSRLKAERQLLARAMAHLKAAGDSEALHRAVIEGLPDPVVLRDGSGRALLANAAFARLLPDRSGASSPCVIERGPALDQPDGSRPLDEAIRTRGGVRWFAWTEAEIAMADGSRGILRSGREITDRIAGERALEEARIKAEAASEAKSRFLATVSHEFRTPLNGILGMSDLLLDTRLEPEQATYVQALRGSAEAFLSLIEEILDFSKIEAGRIDLVEEPFEIEPLVQGVVELLAPRAQDKGIEIACFVSRDVPPAAISDRDRLRQILFNLAGNAVKFTQNGGVCLSVELGPDGQVVFAVEDTGPGIEPDRLASVFEEFDQGGSRTARGSGTGLGLAISRRIADRMGGVIEVQSAVGRGSTFRLRLPLPPAGTAGVAGRPSADALRVLILGSSPFEPVCLDRRLAEAGAETARASDLDAARDLMTALRFDVLIVDGAFGSDRVREIAGAARAAGIGRTIVLLSPFERRDFGPPRSVGFDAYLTKPVRARSLFERLSGGGTIRPAAAPRVARPGAPLPRRGARVLLAEDNEVNSLLAMKALEKLGALVDWAKDGLEAVAMANAALSGERPAYDLILMDMRMPGLDGAEATRRIREREAEQGGEESCRIVALTASIVGGRERYRETAGFDDFLAKPFTLEALAAQLDGPAPLAAAS